MQVCILKAAMVWIKIYKKEDKFAQKLYKSKGSLYLKFDFNFHVEHKYHSRSFLTSSCMPFWLKNWNQKKKIWPNVKSVKTAQLSIKSSSFHFNFDFCEWIEGIVVFRRPGNLTGNSWWLGQRITLGLLTLALKGPKFWLFCADLGTWDFFNVDQCNANAGFIHLTTY